MVWAMKNHSSKVLLILILLSARTIPSDAQVMVEAVKSPHELRIPAGFELGLGTGYTLPHRDMMQHLVSGHSRRIAISYGWELSGGWTENRSSNGKPWQGFEIAWTDLGGDALGSVTSALWMTRFPCIIGHTELGLGAGWSSNPWDADNAPSSVAMSTRFNAGLHAAWTFPIRSTERSQWCVKTSFTHFSNGAISLPNLGINNIGISILHQWREENILPQRKLNESRSTSPSPLIFELSIRSGARDVGLPGGALHPIFNVHLLGLYHSNRAKSKSRCWAIGNDVGYNQSLRITGTKSAAENPVNRLQYSVLGGIRWDFHRVQLTALQGWTFTNPDLELGRSYLMVTMQYECSPSVAIELGLKSSQFRADYPFIGIRHELGN